MPAVLPQCETDEKILAGACVPVANRTRFALVVEYDGTRYYGSQFQSELPTVQSELEKALFSLTGDEIRVSMAGRTDAGVHARGQVVSFVTVSPLVEYNFICGLNHYLPSDISVMSARMVDMDFDPRRSALKREYEYYILNSSTRSAIWHGRAWQMAGNVNIDAMNDACRCLIGAHDFASFASSLNHQEKSTCRCLYEASVRREEDMIIVKMVGNAFLLHQVRNTVGVLLRVGQGKMTQDEFKAIINARELGLAGPAAPACGLYLNKVYYQATN
jgi:tRNA pseudouridine38-40 synthase